MCWAFQQIRPLFPTHDNSQTFGKRSISLTLREHGDGDRSMQNANVAVGHAGETGTAPGISLRVYKGEEDLPDVIRLIETELRCVTPGRFDWLTSPVSHTIFTPTGTFYTSGMCDGDAVGQD